MTRERLSPDVRKETLIVAALAVAKRDGFSNLTRASIAEEAACSTGLVTNYLGTMTALKREVMRAAVKREVVEVVAEGLAVRDKQALKAPEELKQKAIAHLTN